MTLHPQPLARSRAPQVIVPLLLAALAGPAWAGPPAHYSLDPAKSTLEFEFVQAGAKNKGKFLKFPVTLEFAPDAAPAGRLDVTVDIASLNTADKDRDETLRGADLFDAAKFPQARFLATRIEKTGAGYVAQGKLTIRGVTRDVPVAFTFRDANEGGKTVGYLAGSTTIHRLDFGVGQGDWKNTGADGIANDVKVSYSLRLVAGP
jgi:polyisoprenoid-binding protein YceI